MWGSGGTAPLFFTSALDGGEWSASRLYRFTPGDTARCTYWKGSWVGPRVGLGRCGENKKKSCTAGNRTQAVQPVVHRHTALSSLQSVNSKTPLKLNSEWNSKRRGALERAKKCPRLERDSMSCLHGVLTPKPVQTTVFNSWSGPVSAVSGCLVAAWYGDGKNAWVL
jgi:hypothetical protein